MNSLVILWSTKSDLTYSVTTHILTSIANRSKAWNPHAALHRLQAPMYVVYACNHDCGMIMESLLSITQLVFATIK